MRFIIREACNIKGHEVSVYQSDKWQAMEVFLRCRAPTKNVRYLQKNTAPVHAARHPKRLISKNKALPTNAYWQKKVKIAKRPQLKRFSVLKWITLSSYITPQEHTAIVLSHSLPLRGDARAGQRYFRGTSSALPPSVLPNFVILDRG